MHSRLVKSPLDLLRRLTDYAEVERLQDKFSHTNKVSREKSDDGDIRAHKTTTKANRRQPTSCLFEPYIINKPQQKAGTTY